MIFMGSGTMVTSFLRKWIFSAMLHYNTLTIFIVRAVLLATVSALTSIALKLKTLCP